MNLVLLATAGYVVVQFAVGLLASRRIRAEDDYLLAGRRLGMPLATFTIFATWFGAETCVGAAGAVYANGLGAGSADPFGYALCILLMGLIYAGTLWTSRATTIADILRSRFSVRVERVAVLLIVPTSLLWAAAQMRAMGQVLGHLGGLDGDMAIVISAAVAVAYTVRGGLMADAVTDLVQGVCLIAGLGVLLAFVVAATGSPLEALARVEPERLALFGTSGTALDTLEAWALPVCGSVVAQKLGPRDSLPNRREAFRGPRSRSLPFGWPRPSLRGPHRGFTPAGTRRGRAAVAGARQYLLAAVRARLVQRCARLGHLVHRR